MVGTIVAHHLRFSFPAGVADAAQAWSVQRFGAVPGMHLNYAAADLPTINLNFSDAAGPVAPSEGQDAG